MAANFDRDEILRGLQILYPADHGTFELDVLKKSGKMMPGHFDNLEAMLDEIERYDGRSDVLAIYTALNKIKTEAFKRLDHPLEVSNGVASGLRIDGEDVARVTGILFDIDPKRGHGNNKDSTTDAEHQAGLDAADSLKHKLSLMGWPEPVMGSSGNGATLRYLADLPATPETEDLLSRMLKAANTLLPDHLKGLVEVDSAMFDRPRISKVFGTMTRKGPETLERPHRRAQIISAPEKFEPVQIDSIMKLINAAQKTDPIEDILQPRPNPSKNRIKPLSDVENDPAIKPCLKEIILNKDIKQLEDVSAHEHKGRVAIATELILAGYSDEALHSFFSRLKDYDQKVTTVQIKQILNKFVEGKGGQSWLCKTLRDTEVIPSEKCEGCKWVGHGQDPLIVLKTRVKADPRALKDITILKTMAELKATDPLEYDLLVDAIKKMHKGLKVDTINALVDKYALENQTVVARPTESPEAIKDKALAISARGDPYKYLIWQAQRNHLGDISYQKVLISSIASTASLTSQGIQPGGTGDKGSGKSDACAATYHLVPMDRRLDSSLSPMSLFYLQETGRLKPGMVLFSDDVEYEPILPIYKRSTARFQQGITHTTVSGGKNREALELHIPPRMSWWLTSVESVANEQANDRQSPISTNSSPAHKKMVSKEIGARRARKELRLAEDEGILIARQILTDIFDNGPFKVLIPQAAKAEWLKYSDFRGQEQFWDLVDALAVLRWRQRHKDEDGWLVAADEDLIEAKDILTAHKVANISDLTPAEVQLVEGLTSGQTKTQKELTEALGIAQSTLSERLKSILAKSALITEDWENGKKVYALNPKMNVGAAFWAGLELIDAKIESEEAYRRQQIAFSGCYRYVIGIPIGIIISNSSRIPISLSVQKGGVWREEGCSYKKCLGLLDISNGDGQFSDSDHIPFSIHFLQNTDNAQKQSVDRDLCTDKVIDDYDNRPKTLSEEGDKHKEHFKTPSHPNLNVQFKTDYDSDWHGIMRQFKEGEIVEIPAERAETWIKRGIVEEVSEMTPAPDEPANMESSEMIRVAAT